MKIRAINIARWLVHPLLWVSQFINDNTFQVVCLGYGEDYDNYTGLVWADDKDLPVYDKEYTNFQVWL